MVFSSQYPAVQYPTDLSIWEWVFEHERWSRVRGVARNELAGFTDAVSGERLDFLLVKQHATNLCTALVKLHGLQAGDTVSLFCGNSIWYPVALFATLRAGGRVNGASPAYNAEEMTHALQTAKTKYLITVPGSLKVARAAARAAGLPASRIFLLEGEARGHLTVNQLTAHGKQYGESAQSPICPIPSGSTNADVCAFLTFSSGTTGLPKAVMLSHKNMIAQCEQNRDVAGSQKKRILACLPLFHISGLMRFVNWPVANNEECVMLPQFTMETCLAAIAKYRITDLSLVPAIIIRLARDPIVATYDVTSLQRLACGAAPLGPDVLDEVRAKFPWTGFRQSYGMTESCCALTTHPPEFYDYKYGDSGGMLLASTEIKILDLKNGKELGPNETGEILARGPQNAMGYLDNVESTSETFGSDGWLRTGDVGSIDEQGFIHIVDRVKDMIKVKGQQVAPAELEQLLLSHPQVDDCAVTGIMYEATERPKAFVVLKSGIEPTKELGAQLLDYVRQRKIRYKWVREVEFLTEIPKSPSSKILRRKLKNRGKDDARGLVVKSDSASGQPKL